MSAATSHPLAAAYLRDLEMLLHGLDPGERAEVLSGVREHLSAALGPEATSDEVRAALTELGSPQSIADEAYADQRAVIAPAPSSPTRWHAVLASALNGAGLAYLFLLAWAVMSPTDLLAVIPVFLLPWVAVVALSARSPVWTPREKAFSIGLGPATLAGLVLLGAGFVALFGASVLDLVPVLVVFAASTWVLVRLLRHALR